MVHSGRMLFPERVLWGSLCIVLLVMVGGGVSVARGSVGHRLHTTAAATPVLLPEQESEDGSSGSSRISSSSSSKSSSSSGGSNNYQDQKEKLVFDDDFQDLDLSVWEHEITMGGGGNWEFQYYTNNRTNSYVDEGVLYLKPTLTSDKIGEKNVQTGYTMDLWGSQPANMCTGNQFWGCSRTSGAGGNILNPVQSARVRTARSFNIKYGRLEVRAKLPRGDWLWPAIWMLPRHNHYGEWPASGEIDILEAKGNDGKAYKADGNDVSMSTIHWGPDWTLNGWPKTHGKFKLPPGKTFADDYHTFGLYWTDKDLYTYVDHPDNKVIDVKFDQTFWKRGDFDKSGRAHNPWAANNKKEGSNAAPFDQEFYLIMNVAVGGTSNFFPDGEGGKPWKNSGSNAVNDFYAQKAQWLSTWCTEKDPTSCAMKVDRVKVWKLA